MGEGAKMIDHRGVHKTDRQKTFNVTMNIPDFKYWKCVTKKCIKDFFDIVALDMPFTCSVIFDITVLTNEIPLLQKMSLKCFQKILHYEIGNGAAYCVSRRIILIYFTLSLLPKLEKLNCSLSVCLSVCLSGYLSVCLSVWLFDLFLPFLEQAREKTLWGGNYPKVTAAISW